MHTGILVVLASSRKNSDTRKFLEMAMVNIPHRVLDLLDYTLHPYSYSGQYPAGDKFDEITDLILQHRNIIFATPVYWYSMSGLLKNLFDRLTDLVTIRKEAGRMLKGKNVFLLAVGANEVLPPGFTIPFELSAQYLGMEYKGSIYYSTDSTINEESLRKALDVFRSSILEAKH